MLDAQKKWKTPTRPWKDVSWGVMTWGFWIHHLLEFSGRLFSNGFFLGGFLGCGTPQKFLNSTVFCGGKTGTNAEFTLSLRGNKTNGKNETKTFGEAKCWNGHSLLRPSTGKHHQGCESGHRNSVHRGFVGDLLGPTLIFFEVFVPWPENNWNVHHHENPRFLYF